MTKLVKTNSYRVEATFDRMHSACVWPRNFDLAFLMLTDATVFSPMLRLIFAFMWDDQMILRLVTVSDPRSPLFPFVSSTELMESIAFSPFRQSSRAGFKS